MSGYQANSPDPVTNGGLCIVIACYPLQPNPHPYLFLSLITLFIILWKSRLWMTELFHSLWTVSDNDRVCTCRPRLAAISPSNGAGVSQGRHKKKTGSDCAAAVYTGYLSFTGLPPVSLSLTHTQSIDNCIVIPAYPNCTSTTRLRHKVFGEEYGKGEFGGTAWWWNPT